MQAGGEIVQVFDSSRNMFGRSLRVQAPGTVGDPARGVDSSVLFGSTGQKAHQSELASFPPSRDEPVRRGHEPESNQFQLGELDIPRDLELGGAKYCSDIQLLFRVRESSGISFGVLQPIARIWVAPARRDELFLGSCDSFRSQDRKSLLLISWIL